MGSFLEFYEILTILQFDHLTILRFSIKEKEACRDDKPLVFM